MTKIVQNGEAVLREIAKEVPVNEIKSPKIAAILGRMKEALDSQEDGVAIAAPQIGESLRIFVISERALDIPKEISDRRKIPKEKNKNYGYLIFINPTLTKISKKKTLLEEGCLSVRYKYGKIERADKATVIAFDEHGKKFTRGGSGLMAQIFQHETDHLEGVLFIDKAVDVKDLPPKEASKNS